MILPPVNWEEMQRSEKTLYEIMREIHFHAFFKGAATELTDSTLKITTDTTLKSFGELIEITLIEEGQENVYRITSRPKIKTTIIDYGKGKKNMKIIKEILN